MLLVLENFHLYNGRWIRKLLDQILCGNEQLLAVTYTKAELN